MWHVVTSFYASDGPLTDASGTGKRFLGHPLRDAPLSDRQHGRHPRPRMAGCQEWARALDGLRPKTADLRRARPYVTVGRMDATTQTFGERLSYLMEALDVSAGELARRMQRQSSSNVRRWKRREKVPSWTTVEHMAAALGVSTGVLTGSEPLPTKEEAAAIALDLPEAAGSAPPAPPKSAPPETLPQVAPLPPSSPEQRDARRPPPPQEKDGDG